MLPVRSGCPFPGLPFPAVLASTHWAAHVLNRAITAKGMTKRAMTERHRSCGHSCLRVSSALIGLRWNIHHPNECRVLEPHRFCHRLSISRSALSENMSEAQTTSALDPWVRG
ncbi:unnamed protein product [Mycena citricolor]|uniref:Uncharacterized protein n=1 Tax=Mycena citricolor TaxID=2018698 RepID=A0AAD2GT72_9AGAR|nr:unnamed protein product [Mycena citricolor]